MPNNPVVPTPPTSTPAVPVPPVVSVTPPAQPDPAPAAGFVPIGSQAELDRIIGERLARQQRQFADYEDLKAKAAKLAELELSQMSELDQLKTVNADLTARVQAFETAEQVKALAVQVSEATGVPATVLRGSTLEELTAHAESLKALGLASPVPAVPALVQGVVPTIGLMPPAPVNQWIGDLLKAAEVAGDLEKVALLKAMQLGAS